jgi:hypothetical protein
MEVVMATFRMHQHVLVAALFNRVDIDINDCVMRDGVLYFEIVGPGVPETGEISATFHVEERHVTFHSLAEGA